jgi:hypothetical protein
MRRRCAAILCAGVTASAMPASAQQAPWLFPPYPTESGKPVIFDPQFAAKGEDDKLSGCRPLPECRFQLLGVIQNNGAVELRATAFRW